MPFGESINAALMRPDYTNIVRAGQLRGAGIASIGQGIGNALESIGEMKKQQKADETEISVAQNIAKLLEQKAPGLVPGAGDLALQMADTEMPRSQRLGIAKYILNSLSLGSKIQDEERQNALLRLRQDQFAWDTRPQPHPGDTAFDTSWTGGETSATTPAMPSYGGRASNSPMGSWLRGQGQGLPVDDSMVLPPKGSIPSNSYVDSLDPFSVP